MAASKYYSLLILFVSLNQYYLRAQKNDWQQKTDYSIDVTLNDEERMLKGNLSLDYFNNSPDTLHFIYFHLWPNAFKNDRTAFSRQMLQMNNTDFYFSGEEEKGYINQLQFMANGKTLTWEEDVQHKDIVRVDLEIPLVPGSSVTITTPFNIKMPFAFLRPGYVGEEFLVTQWYPKPAMYDKDGWHPLPYLHFGEYYNNFGDYRVSIKAKKEYTIAAGGKMIDSIAEGDFTKLIFEQRNITDFAWFALKHVVHARDTILLSDRVISLNAYYGEDNSENWKNVFTFLKRSLKARSEWIGDYPYDVVSIVERPGQQSMGGMEYPTITLLDSIQRDDVLDMLIDHEVGHNWFQAAIATNEREYPWLDEGFNSFYDNRYKRKFYDSAFDSQVGQSAFLKKRIPADPNLMALETMIKIKADQPINTNSDNLTALNYGLIPYGKTAMWLEHIEQKVGTDKFDLLMKTYYKLWKFRHPQPRDFSMLADSLLGEDLTAEFALLGKTGSWQPLSTRKNFKVSPFFNLKDASRNNYILLTPVIGYNLYNGTMAGIGVHNYSLPLANFRFVAAPMYAFKSKGLQGIGRMSYAKYFEGNASLQLHITASKFKKDKFTDSANIEHLLGFQKISPGLKYIFPQHKKDKRLRTSLSYKFFSITESDVLFKQDPVSHNYVLTFPETKYNNHRVAANVENYRKLYPYHFQLEADAGKHFVRPTLTGNYFFNYAGGGGLQARIFAGKFIYTKTKTTLSQFELRRFHLNMSAPGGFYDYAYNEYFIGRNEIEGFYARQRVEKDGNFKVNTDLLNSQVGTSDNWLAALNFSTTLPNTIYPFNKYLPLRLFLDIGTNQQLVVDRSGSGRLLYDAGLQISAFNDLVKINLPLLYSKPFRDYYKNVFPGKNLLQTISFNISIDNDLIKKQLPELRF